MEEPAAPPGAAVTEERLVYARSTTFQAEPASIDAGVAYMRDTVLPALEELGAAGMSLMVDRRLGRCIATSAW